jgi:hypothetical protein
LNILTQRVEPGIGEATDQNRTQSVWVGWIAILTGDIIELTIRTPTFDEDETFYWSRYKVTLWDLK